MAEMEVTAEMIQAGLHAWFNRTTRGPADTHEAIVSTIYRAMRALEPEPMRHDVEWFANPIGIPYRRCKVCGAGENEIVIGREALSPCPGLRDLEVVK